MNSKQLISKDIEVFYNKASEETRLEKGMGVFEFERIKSLIDKYIPRHNSTIIDVGGGTGKYAEWLANKGHEVHLIEPVEKHLKLANARSGKSKSKFSVNKGEARNLKFPSNYADLIILHGPLYHLQQKEDRLQAILESKRVLKVGGILLGFAINYTASTLVGLLQGLIHKDTFFMMCKEELLSGEHNPPDEFPWLLAEAYFHRPEELKAEFLDAGLACLKMYAIEGITWLDKNYFSNMVDPNNRKTLLELLSITENDDSLLPFSPHMMIAVKKQKNER